MRAQIRKAVDRFDEAISDWFHQHGFEGRPDWGENAAWDSGARAYLWDFQRIRENIENVGISYFPRLKGLGTQLSSIPKSLEVPDAWAPEYSSIEALPPGAARDYVANLNRRKKWWELFSQGGHLLRYEDSEFSKDLHLYLSDLEEVENFFAGNINRKKVSFSYEMQLRLDRQE